MREGGHVDAPRVRWVDNINMDLQDVRWHVSRAVVNAVMNFRVP